MKEFVIYTALRIVLFMAALALVSGVWLAFDDRPPFLLVFLVSLAASGVASYFLLRGPRERFAQVVEARAAKGVQKFEQLRSAEDD